MIKNLAKTRGNCNISLSEFKSILSKSQKWAKENSMTEEDIASAIKAVRKHS